MPGRTLGRARTLNRRGVTGLIGHAIGFQRYKTHGPGRRRPTSGWRFHHGTAVGDVDAPTLLMHPTVMLAAQ
jgi:hypothetical protein